MSSLRIDVSQGFAPPSPVYKKANVVFNGHSYIAGAASTKVGTWDFCSRIKNTLTNLDPLIWTVTSVGHGGYRMGYPGDPTGNQLRPLAATEIDPLIKAGQCNILGIMETINSIGWYQATINPATGALYTPAQVTAQAILDHTGYYNERRAAGWTKANGNLLLAFNMHVIPLWVHPDLGYAQCVYDLATWHNNVALPSGLIDGIIADPALDAELGLRPYPSTAAPAIMSGDNTHDTDYGHQIWSDLILPNVVSAYESMPVSKPHAWTPAFLKRLQWWVDMGKTGSYVLWDGVGRVFKLVDRGSWQYDFAASGALMPTHNRTNRSVDGASGNCMTMTQNLNGDYCQRVNIFLSYSCSTTGTVIAELGPNAPGNTNGWVVTHEVGGPKIASYGNVGASVATASVISGSGNHSVIFTIDHSLGSNQGNILLDGVTAPGLARSGGPNTNFFGNLAVNLFGRNGGTSSSTMKLRAAAVTTSVLTAQDISNWQAYQATI